MAFCDLAPSAMDASDLFLDFHAPDSTSPEDDLELFMPKSLPPANPVGDDEFGVGQSLEDLFSGGWANPMDPNANWDATTPFVSESQNVAGSSLSLPHFGVDPPNMGSYTRVMEPPRGDHRVQQDFVAPQGAE